MDTRDLPTQPLEMNKTVKVTDTTRPERAATDIKPEAEVTNNESHMINMSQLQPAELLMIDIRVNGQSCQAMLDTGAANNIIRYSTFIKCGLENLIEKKSTMIGL